MQGYKSIMVHLSAEGDADPQLGVAAGLAERFGARLIGIAAGDVSLTMNVTSFGSATAQIITLQMAELEAKLRAAEARFRAGIGAAGRPAEWRAFSEFPAEAVAREARAADLVVMTRRSGELDSDFISAASPGDVLMRAGRPLLLVPPGIGSLPAARVLVAWKERRETRRAVLDALPLLAQAERVHVTEICEAAESLEAAAQRTADVAAYLRQHGAEAESSACQRREPTTSRQLAAAAEAFGADLIVAGGYGHARLREWIFGGVTRDLMERASCCCLLSH